METVTGTQFGDSVCGNTENKVEQVGWGVCKARFEDLCFFFWRIMCRQLYMFISFDFFSRRRRENDEAAYSRYNVAPDETM